MCADHWHCNPQLASHSCDVDRSGPCPTCKEVIDAQIIEAHEAGIVDHDTARVAIYTMSDWGRREAARHRCAEMILSNCLIQRRSR